MTESHTSSSDDGSVCGSDDSVTSESSVSSALSVSSTYGVKRYLEADTLAVPWSEFRSSRTHVPKLHLHLDTVLTLLMGTAGNSKPFLYGSQHPGDSRDREKFQTKQQPYLVSAASSQLVLNPISHALSQSATACTLLSITIQRPLDPKVVTHTKPEASNGQKRKHSCSSTIRQHKRQTLGTTPTGIGSPFTAWNVDESTQPLVAARQPDLTRKGKERYACFFYKFDRKKYEACKHNGCENLRELFRTDVSTEPFEFPTLPFELLFIHCLLALNYAFDLSVGYPVATASNVPLLWFDTAVR